MKFLIPVLVSAPLITALTQPYFQTVTLLAETTTKFNTSIEGAAVDASGSGYAVNFGSAAQRNQIGKITFGRHGVFQSLDFAYNDTKTGFNGIRFVCDDTRGTSVYLAADQNNKRVIKVTKKRGVSKGSVFCSHPDMLQGVPNDLAVDLNKKNVYLTGQAWMENTTPADGEIWLCRGNGEAIKLSDSESVLGRTNGVELSLDGRTLYVSEATNVNWAPATNKILSFKVKPDGTLVKGSRRVFYDFADDNSGTVDVDGMRLDVAGNLYVTRNGNGEVVVFSPQGKIIKKVKLAATTAPTNIELVGSKGTKAIVVGRCPRDVAYQGGVGCVDTFDVPFPGRAFTELAARKGQKCTWM